MLFTRRLGSTAISVQTTPVGYVAVVDNRSGGPPIAHWRCGDAAPTGAPPPPSTPSVAQANCFPESSSTTVEVGGSVANIVAAANNAAPGTHILVQPGTYSGGSGEITATGAANSGKIVIRPRDGFGTVTFSGITLDLSGSHIVWTGFRHVNGPRIRLAGGSFNRITRCYFAEITRFIHDVPRGFDHRVDHNEYTTYIAGGNRGVMNFDANHIRDGIVGRIRFDHNYIHDITPSSADG